MSSLNQTSLTPPSLAELLVRFVNRPVDPAAIDAAATALGEVEPHEVAVGFRTDPRLAWQEGLAAVAYLGSSGLKNISAPSEWASQVVRHEALACQPFALANYPQRVRDLNSLLSARDLTALRPTGESKPAAPALSNWVNKQAEKRNPLTTLLAAAVLRSANDLDHAEKLLNATQNEMPDALKPALINEEAALLWQRGQADQAVALWKSLPESPVALFNLGMSSLFLGQAAQAQAILRKVVTMIPEADGWHHLASLYLALAEISESH